MAMDVQGVVLFWREIFDIYRNLSCTRIHNVYRNLVLILNNRTTVGGCGCVVRQERSLLNILVR